MVHCMLALHSLSCCFNKAEEAQGKQVCHAFATQVMRTARVVLN